MQHLKGKLSNVEDLRIFLNRLGKTGGTLHLHLPTPGYNLTICFDGTNYLISTRTSKLPEEKVLKVFIENWLLNGVDPEFELCEGEQCSGRIPLPEEELLNILNDPYLEEVTEIPPRFIVTDVDTSSVPSFLIASWSTKKPINRLEVYKHGLTLSDIVRFAKSGLIKIKPFQNVKILPRKVRLFLQAAALLTVVYLASPINYLNLNKLKITQAINWGLKEKIVGNTKRKKLPVKGCLKTDFYLMGNTIVSTGIDNNIRIKLPERGYIPTFTLPVK